MNYFIGNIRDEDRTKFQPVIVPKGLQQQVMSLNHESAFDGHLGQRRQKLEYSSPSFGQDYARISLGSTVFMTE